jgi:hypothetical protein
MAIDWPIEATTIVENEAGEGERSPNSSITRIDCSFAVQFFHSAVSTATP